LSKVLKYVDVNTHSPYMLKSFSDLKSRVDDNKLDMAKASRNRFYEDVSKQLLEDAVARAQDILSKAKAEAEEIIADAQSQKQEIEKQAVEKGYNEGFENGDREAQRQNRELWEERLSRFNMLRKQLLEKNKIYLDYLEKESLKVALYTAEKILAQKIEVDPGYYLDLIKKGLEKAGEEKNIFVRIPEQVFEKVKAIDELSNIEGKISLVKDPLLSPGDCIIYSDYFEMDAGIHVQVENIRSKLKEIGVIDNA